MAVLQTRRKNKDYDIIFTLFFVCYPFLVFFTVLYYVRKVTASSSLFLYFLCSFFSADTIT
jgi:hypothetical protein